MALFLASFAFSWQATATPAFITASGVTAQARAQFLVMQEDTPSEQPAAPREPGNIFSTCRRVTNNST